MTDEERAGVMEWLDQWASCNDGGTLTIRARQIKAMLAQPRLPEELPQAAVEAVAKAADIAIDAPRCGGTLGETIRRMHAALYAHLTKPKTKTIEVWHVEYAMSGVPQVRVCDDEKTARGYLLPHKDFQCIRVTGPHQHEVPA